MSVLPATPTACSCTTFVKKNCQIFTCLTIGTGFNSTILFCSQARRCAHIIVNAYGQFRALALIVLLLVLSTGHFTFWISLSL